MDSNKRQIILKLAAGAVVGLFLLDRLVLTPIFDSWKSSSERTAALRAKVTRGRQLLKSEASLRSRWLEMRKSALPSDDSAAENGVYKAIGRWAQESHVNLTSLTPEWRSHKEGYETFECRATAAGSQAALGRLIYELEVDPLPARLEQCDLAVRDAKGQQLNLTMKFSFIRLNEAKGVLR